MKTLRNLTTGVLDFPIVYHGRPRHVIIDARSSQTVDLEIYAVLEASKAFKTAIRKGSVTVVEPKRHVAVLEAPKVMTEVVAEAGDEPKKASKKRGGKKDGGSGDQGPGDEAGHAAGSGTP